MEEVPEIDLGFRMCTNCGLHDSSGTGGLCFQCYCQRFNEQHAGSASSSFSASPSTVVVDDLSESAVATVKAWRRQPKRCHVCRKKVGLLGFRCRCGESYCGRHRLPEFHACTIDYKLARRKRIKCENPTPSPSLRSCPGCRRPAPTALSASTCSPRSS